MFRTEGSYILWDTLVLLEAADVGGLSKERMGGKGGRKEGCCLA